VKPELRDKAYGDFTLDIGEDQVVSPPYIVAIMTYAVVAPGYNKKVLEIGTGSGYHAAVLAELAKYVYTIERLGSLAEKAQKRLDSMGYKNIKFKIGDGYEGWEKYAPYDGIIVTCAEDHIPQPLINQLAVGGRMIIPVRYALNIQELILLEKDSQGQLKKTHLIPVQAVPSLIRGSEKND
jgi:protein-L-isoaspartate(D-aspartate) O-methyltransferase